MGDGVCVAVCGWGVQCIAVINMTNSPWHVRMGGSEWEGGG